MGCGWGGGGGGGVFPVDGGGGGGGSCVAVAHSRQDHSVSANLTRPTLTGNRRLQAYA